MNLKEELVIFLNPMYSSSELAIHIVVANFDEIILLHSFLDHYSMMIVEASCVRKSILNKKLLSYLLSFNVA